MVREHRMNDNLYFININSMYAVLSVFKESFLWASYVDILCRVSFNLVSTCFQVFADVTTAYRQRMKL